MHSKISEHTLNILLISFIPVIFGVMSLYIGQDHNWDFRNYHLYNGFSFLNNRLHVDLSPSGMQTYFNPLIDSAYYWGDNKF